MAKAKSFIITTVLVLLCIAVLAPVYFLLINSILPPDSLPESQILFPNAFSLKQYWKLVVGSEG